MKCKIWALTLLIGCALTACGAAEPGGATSTGIRPGDPVDLNGDGKPDGVAVDTNGDNRADGVDTDGDGDVDAPLPSGSGGNGTGGQSNGTSGDGNCQEIIADARPTIPDMLIVLDRSGSMKRGAVNRWDPSVGAVRSITASLDKKIRFGMSLFPKPCPTSDLVCEELNACEAGALDVPIGIGSSAAIGSLLNDTEPEGGTPTGATLQVARKILNGQKPGPDEAVAPKFVLLVTDGQPTCPNGDGGTDATAQELLADKALTVQAIDQLLSDDVKTYVIGYDADANPVLANALTEFAQHGGTTDYRPVEDEASLLKEFQSIAGDVVSCSYQLDTVPTDPSYVLVTLDGTQLNLDGANGWSISGKLVTIEGQACKILQDGKEHRLSVQVKCEQVPII